jgi:hypothetical protein
MAAMRNSAIRNRRDFPDCSSLARAYSIVCWALRDLLLTKMEARTCDNPDARSSSMRRRDSRRLYSVAPIAYYSSSPSCRRCVDSTPRRFRAMTPHRRNCAMESKSVASSTLCCGSSMGWLRGSRHCSCRVLDSPASCPRPCSRCGILPHSSPSGAQVQSHAQNFGYPSSSFPRERDRFEMLR